MEDKDKVSGDESNKNINQDFDLSSFDLDDIEINPSKQNTDSGDFDLDSVDASINSQVQTKPKKSGKRILRAWFRTILVIFFITIILRTFLFGIYVIPNNNMGSTLESTDYVWVNKFAYGARLPKTILHIPFTYQNIWGTDVPSYTELFSTRDKNYGRVWGFTQPQKQDILVFGLPNDNLHPIDLKDNAIGRCVAVAGDTLRLVNGRVNVNGKKLIEMNTIEYGFKPKKGKIKVFTEEEAKKKKSKYKRIIVKKGERNPNIIPKHPDFDWNEDNLGPFVIPKKGMKIPLSKHNVALYADVIINHDFLPISEVKEGNLILSKIVVKNDKLILQSKTSNKKSKVKEKVLKDYTFRQDYYFVLSDRRYKTIDSRHFGLVPKNHIIGRADLVLVSYQGKKIWYNPLGWNRWFLNVK